MKHLVLFTFLLMQCITSTAETPEQQTQQVHMRKYALDLNGNHKPTRSPALVLLPFEIYLNSDNNTLNVTGDFEDVMTFYIINDAGLIINQGIVDLTSGNYQICMQEFDNGKYSLVIKYFDTYYIGDFNL